LDSSRKPGKRSLLESAAWAESVAELRGAGGFGDRPLIVLTAGKPYDPDPLLRKEQMERQNDLWTHDLQAQEARLSTRGKQIIVSDSSHIYCYAESGGLFTVITATGDGEFAPEQLVTPHKNEPSPANKDAEEVPHAFPFLSSTGTDS
jgi:hypothetical protein